MSDHRVSSHQKSAYLQHVQTARRPSSPTRPNLPRVCPLSDVPDVLPHLQRTLTNCWLPASLPAFWRGPPAVPFGIGRLLGMHIGPRIGRQTSGILLAGGCTLGAWVCSRLVRHWPGYSGVVATALALAAGAAFVFGPPHGPVWPQAPGTRGRPSTPPPRPQRPHAAPDPAAAAAEARRAALCRRMQTRLVGDETLLYKVSAWASAADVAAGHPQALACRSQAAADSGLSPLAAAHVQQVILAASLQTYRLMQPSRRNSVAEQLSLLVARHAACLEDCYQMLAYPEDAERIAHRIVEPTAAWCAHEDAIERLGAERGEDVDYIALSRLYDNAPPRYHKAPAVRLETLQAYCNTEAKRLAERVVTSFASADATLRTQADPDAGEDSARVEAWLDAVCAHDPRGAWQPHYTPHYLTVGEIDVARPLEVNPAAPSDDDSIARLEARKQYHQLCNVAEQDEAACFARQLFDDTTRDNIYDTMPRQRDNEGCYVSAFFVANMHALSGQSAHARGRATQRHASTLRPNRPELQIERLTRAAQASYDLLDACERSRQKLQQALRVPNTSRKHAACAERLAALTVWGYAQLDHYDSIQDALRNARYNAPHDVAR